MTHSNDDFTPEMVNEQIEHFLQLREPRQQTPSSALTQALKAVCEEDAVSLERVWERYDARIRALLTSDSQSFTHVSLSLQQKKELTMHDVQEKRETMFIQPPAQRKTGWKQRLGVLAAILCTMILVGGFFAIANTVRANRTTAAGSQTMGTPTPQPTARSTSRAIQKAILTDSPTGNSEGVGPGLSGIVSKNHFTVGQQIWLFYLVTLVTSDKRGTVTSKWYDNNRLARSLSQSIPSLAPTPGKAPSPVPTPSRNSSSQGVGPIESHFSVVYQLPGQDKVELYWNGQLAMTLFFVVSPKA